MLKRTGCLTPSFLFLLIHCFSFSLSADSFLQKPVNVINAGLNNDLLLKTLRILNEEVPTIISNRTVPLKSNCNWLLEYADRYIKHHDIPLIILKAKPYCSHILLNSTRIAIITLDKGIKSKIIHQLVHDAIEKLNFYSDGDILQVLSSKENHLLNDPRNIFLITSTLFCLTVIGLCSISYCIAKLSSSATSSNQRSSEEQGKIPSISKNAISKKISFDSKSKLRIKPYLKNYTQQHNENRKSCQINDFEVEPTGSLASTKAEWLITEPTPRSTYELVNEPVKPDEFVYYLQQLATVVTDYSTNPDKYNVTADVKPGDIFKKIAKFGPENPENFDNICSDFKTFVLSGLTHWQHPRFHAYYPAGRNYACMLADLAISSLGVVGFSWDSCPVLTEMEHSMTNWVGRALGLPEHFLFQEPLESSKGGGCLLESSSDAIHNVLLASRQKKIDELLGHLQSSVGAKNSLQTNHDLCKKFVVYTSKEAHSSIEKGCKLTMMNCRLINTSIDNDFGLTGEEIETEILKDLENGLIPVHIHATLGTTSTATADHLQSIWPVAQKYKMWLHVDAAYSGSTWIIPKYRSECKGMEHVDSLNVNAHKLLQHSVGCCMLWVRDQSCYKKAFRIHPEYLQPTHVNSNDLRDWGVSLSRRFLCLKSWFVFRLYGIRGLQSYIQNLIDNAIYFENLVSTHPNCRIFGKRKHALFCFQYVEANATEDSINQLTREFCSYVNSSRLMFFTLTKVQQHTIIRISVNYEKSNPELIDESWRCLRSLIDQFKQQRQCLSETSSANSFNGLEPISSSRKFGQVFREDEYYNAFLAHSSMSKLFSD